MDMVANAPTRPANRGRPSRVGRLALAHDPTIVRLNWVAVVLKTLGGLLALGLIQRWGQPLPRHLLLTASWGGAGLLTIYGGSQLTVLSLVQLGITHPAGPVDWTSIHWRLGLWDMWFLVWGLCLGAAARQYTRQPQLVGVDDEPVDEGPAPHATLSQTGPKTGSPR